MLKKGEVFEVMDSVDNEGNFPQGHFVALRDLSAEEVIALRQEDDLMFPESLLIRELAVPAVMPSVWIQDGIVEEVGTWKREG